MKSLIQNLFYTLLITASSVAHPQNLSFIQACLSELRTGTSPEACAGVHTGNQLRAVLACVSLVRDGDRAAACKGVQNELQAQVVGECVKTLGTFPGRACTGVRDHHEIETVETCVRTVGNGKSALACQLR